MFCFPSLLPWFLINMWWHERLQTLLKKKQLVFHKQGKLIFFEQTYCWHYHHNAHHNAHPNSTDTASHHHHHRVTLLNEAEATPYLRSKDLIIPSPEIHWVGWGMESHGVLVMNFWQLLKKGKRKMGSIIFLGRGNQRSSTYMVILMVLPICL